MIVLINAFLTRVSKLFIIISAMFLALMAIIGTIDVFTLNILGVPIPAATELISAMLPIAIMMAMSYTQITRSHISVELFNKFFPSWMSRAVEVLSLLAGIIVFFLMAWGAWRLSLHSFSINERAVAAVRFTIWPIKIIFSLGISIALLQMFFDLLQKLQSPLPAEPSR